MEASNSNPTDQQAAPGPGLNPGASAAVQFMDLLLYLGRYVLAWSIVWLLLWQLGPGWLLPSGAAVGTAAQVLPAIIVSVFVFVLGSLFVVTQLGTSIHTNRASLLLLFDPAAQRAVARPLVIAGFTLLLALVETEHQSDGVSALAVVLTVVTIATLLASARLLPSMISRVTAPRNFVLWMMEQVPRFLGIGDTDAVVWRVGALGEMLRRGVRNGDSLQLRQALGGLSAMTEVYTEAAAENGSIRIHQYSEGPPEVGWLGNEMVPSLVTAGQDGVGLDIADDDVNAIASALADFGSTSATHHHREEFLDAAHGLGGLGTCSQQARAPGLFNVLAESVFALAVLVAAANDELNEDVCATALADWALVVAYQMRHLTGWTMGPRHTMWERSLERFGSDVPFAAAHDVASSPEFQRRWVNKLATIGPEFAFDANGEPQPTGRDGGLNAVHDTLDDAESEAQ